MVPEKKGDGPGQALAARLHLVDEVRPATGLPVVLAHRLQLVVPAHCAQTGWTPRNGLGASYLCRVLRANRKSVQKVLATLKDVRAGPAP